MCTSRFKHYEDVDDAWKDEFVFEKGVILTNNWKKVDADFIDDLVRVRSTFSDKMKAYRNDMIF